MAMNIDFPALRQGGAIALVLGAPCAVSSSALAQGNDQNSSLVALLWLGAVFGFVLGAGVAAWVQRRAMPLVHGMICAGGTYLVVQLAFSVVRLARGREVSWLGLFFTFTVVLFAGLIGGSLGGLLQKKGFAPRVERPSQVRGGK